MIAIVGCGNLNRSDDGLGPKVIHALRARGLGRDNVRLIDAGTDGMAAMFSARGCSALIVIDACTSGSEPGAIFELPGAEVERAYEPGLNLHDFRWDHAIHAGRKIFREAFPQDVTVFLVEAESTAFGLDPSPAVAAAATTVVERIFARVGAVAAPSPA